MATYLDQFESPKQGDFDFYIRRKVLKIFGGSFHVYDSRDNLVFFSSQKAFKLKEDIRVFSDESMSEVSLRGQASEPDVLKPSNACLSPYLIPFSISGRDFFSAKMCREGPRRRREAAQTRAEAAAAAAAGASGRGAGRTAREA